MIIIKIKMTIIKINITMNILIMKMMKKYIYADADQLCSRDIMNSDAAYDTLDRYMSTDCVFCKIIRGESPAKIVYKDEDFVAFYDTKPSAPVHILMVPLEHIESINALEERHGAVISKMMLRAKDLARQFGIYDSGYKLVINVGSGAGQIIFHLHIHLIGGWGKT